MSPRGRAEAQRNPQSRSRAAALTAFPSAAGARVSHAFDTDTPLKPDDESLYLERAGFRRTEADFNRDQAAEDDSGRPTGDPVYDWSIPDLGMSVEGTRHPSLRDVPTPGSPRVDRDGEEIVEPPDRVGSWTDTVVSRRIADMYAGVLKYTPQAFHHLLGRRLTAHRELIRPEDLPATGVEVSAYHDDRGLRLRDKDEQAIRRGERRASDFGASVTERFEIHTAPTWGFSCVKNEYLASDAGSTRVNREGWDALAARADPAMLFAVRVSSGRYDVDATGPEHSPYAEPALDSVWPEAKNQEWYLKGRQSVYLGFTEEDTLAKLERSAEDAHCIRCLADPLASMAAERHWAGNRRVVAVAVEETGRFPEDSRIALGAAAVYDENMWDDRERLRFAGRVAAVVGREWETPDGASPADTAFIADAAEHYPVLATAVAQHAPDSLLALEPPAEYVTRWRTGVQHAIDVAMSDALRQGDVPDGPSLQTRILHGVGRHAQSLAQSADEPLSLGPPTAGPEASVVPVRPASDLDPVAPRSPAAVVDAVDRALDTVLEERVQERERHVEERQGAPAPSDERPLPDALCPDQIAVLRKAVDAPPSPSGAFECTAEVRSALQRIGGVLAPSAGDVEERIDLLHLHRAEPVDDHVASIRSEIVFTDRMTARLEGRPTPRAGSDYLRGAGEDHLKPQTAECAWHMARGALDRVADAAEDVRRDRRQDLADLDRADLLDARGLSVGTGPDATSVSQLSAAAVNVPSVILRSDYVEFCDRAVDVTKSVLASEQFPAASSREIKKSLSSFRAAADAMPLSVTFEEFEKVRGQGLDLVRGAAEGVSAVVAEERGVAGPDRRALGQAVAGRVCSDFLKPGRFPAQSEPVSAAAAERDPVEASVRRVWAAVGGPQAFRARVVPAKPETPKPSPERVASQAGDVYSRLRKAGSVDLVPGLTPAESRRQVAAAVALRLTKSPVSGVAPLQASSPSSRRPPAAARVPAGGPADDLGNPAVAVARARAVHADSRRFDGQRRAVDKAAALVIGHLRETGRLDAVLAAATPSRGRRSAPAQPGAASASGSARAKRSGSRSASSTPSKSPPASGAKGSKSKSQSQTRGSRASAAAGSKKAAVVRRSGARVGGAPAAAAGSRSGSRAGEGPAKAPVGSDRSKR